MLSNILLLCSAAADSVIKHQEASTVILYSVPALPGKKLRVKVEIACDRLGLQEKGFVCG